MRKTTWVIILALGLLLASCAPGGGRYRKDRPAGFLSGIWHGWIAPVTLIVGIFDGNIRVYEINNSGWWYDFGFYIAIIGGFGGLSLTRKKRKRFDE
ncbi:MAG TPA: hypothetical protein ENN17_01665 [bacterium]|nr:hypothetical protein [bacterium]